MDIFSWEIVLSNLPTVLTMWAALTVSWGTYVMITYIKLHQLSTAPKEISHCNVLNIKFMLMFNVVLVLYLLFESTIDYSIIDAITVVNTFYCVYLIPTSITAYRMWKSRIDSMQRLIYPIVQ